MKKKVVFRSDASEQIGLGHVTRCLALSEMIEDLFQVEFLCRGNDARVKQLIMNYGYLYKSIPVNIPYSEDAVIVSKYSNNKCLIILDGYGFNSEYQATIKDNCYKLICIDDIHEYHFFADIVINYSLKTRVDDYSCEPYTRLYLGSKYTLLRQPFLKNWHLKNIEKFKPVKKIMIAMGGSDTTNQSLKILQMLKETNLNFEINLIVGHVNQNYNIINDWIQSEKNSKLRINLLKSLNAEEMCYQFIINDFLFTTGSVTAMEACCIGIPMIIGIIANNQKETTLSLEEFGVAYSVNCYDKISINLLKKTFLELIRDILRLNELVLKQKKLVDGKTNERYRQLFIPLT